MNCANHPDLEKVAFCRTCGKALCSHCVRDVRGVIYCETCLAERLAGVQPPTVYAQMMDQGLGVQVPSDARMPSPGLAATLGFIPGVGAMYNGQFMKGVIHVLAFVCLIWMAARFGPIMVPVFFAYFFYLVFDAYKTAHAIELGQPVPDPFGLEAMFGGTPTPRPTTVPGVVPGDPNCAADAACGKSTPIGAFVLIFLGVLFLLDNLGLFEFRWAHRLWPLILIAIGGWLFAKRWER